MESPFEQKYPNISRWVDECGWIEIGNIEGFSTFVMALDEGGMVWEGKSTYANLDEAFRDLEKALGKWFKENLAE